MMKTYYNLTKPGIIYGNAITATAGFFLASQGQIDWQLLLAALVGLSLIIASGCVFNNLFDRDIDSRMERTKNRALAKGSISKQSAIIYAITLGLVGTLVLMNYTNFLTTLVALTGLFIYVGLYSPLKRHSIHATLVGSLAGATPPVVGYCAVTNQFDLGAIILFLILVAWQMPHFYVIAIRRLDEYRAASIPVLPIKKGVQVTKIYIVIYIISYIIITSLLTVFGFTGVTFLAVTVFLGLTWLRFAIQGFRTPTNDQQWASKMFRFSLVVLTILSLTIVIDSIILT
ncbi:MAG: protoheme IX farnesyltransferase [Candidatus Doudnabacteria bacterium RIFCSPHIGHO2_01_FULL_45_18]|uniref:Protoheme IX farnesyltransferase n=1 Tax=Candidatus Doudnabacteria bacterium RIFCSPHIGHO2_01_FULL_45_18 TaxID=1817823 RepID=A0A1F5NS00_9BACT|nr:MAG: protoheme IX farnesyltransferase [Candidatus Doudnabacteria bacterium RIFCSPHIGHO2_01_FULL_45_18]